MLRSAHALFACLVPILLCGCGSIRMKTVHAEDTVIDRRPETVRRSGVQVDAALDGTVLSIASRERCALVETATILRVETREADEDLPEEITLMVVGAIPIAIGAALIADSGNVYPTDRNARQYNPIGQDGALVAGGVLVGLGALIIVPTVIRLGRVASAHEERERRFDKRGAVIDPNAPCPAAPGVVAVPVDLRIGTRSFRLAPLPGRPLGTSENPGVVEVDLLDVIPPELLTPEAIAKQPLALLFVAGKKELEIDLQGLVAERARRDDHVMWQRARPACAENPTRETCRGVEAYLQRFPQGAHAQEAQSLLASIPPLVVPEEAPPDAGPPDAGVAPKAGKREKCEAACVVACKNKVLCAANCIVEKCR